MKQQIDVGSLMMDFEEIYTKIHQIKVAVLKSEEAKIDPCIELQTGALIQELQELQAMARMQRRIQNDVSGAAKAQAFIGYFERPRESVTEAVRGWGRKLWRSAQIAEKANGLLMAGHELKVI